MKLTDEQKRTLDILAYHSNKDDDGMNKRNLHRFVESVTTLAVEEAKAELATEIANKLQTITEGM